MSLFTFFSTHLCSDICMYIYIHIQAYVYMHATEAKQCTYMVVSITKGSPMDHEMYNPYYGQWATLEHVLMILGKPHMHTRAYTHSTL